MAFAMQGNYVVNSPEFHNWVMAPFTKPEPKPVHNLDDIIITKYPTGSRFICDPPPMDTDNDTIVLVKAPMKEVVYTLNQAGWKTQYDESYGTDQENKFISFRPEIARYEDIVKYS